MFYLLFEEEHVVRIIILGYYFYFILFNFLFFFIYFVYRLASVQEQRLPDVRLSPTADETPPITPTSGKVLLLTA